MASVSRVITFPKLTNNYVTSSAVQKAALQKLKEQSSALGPGEIVGAVIAFPVGDSFAYYIVNQENPIKLGYIPYDDEVIASYIEINKITKKDILKYKV